MKAFSGFWDNVRLAVGTLWVNPLRSMLTLLGVVIGVATVVSMMALIEGLRLKVTRDLSQLGANAFTVSKWPGGINFGRIDWRRFQQRPAFRLSDVQLIRESCPAVKTASGQSGFGAFKVASDRAETSPNVFTIGATAEWIETSGVIGIAEGRFYSTNEVEEERPVVVLGSEVAAQLFPGQSPLGQMVRVGGKMLHVIGVLTKRGKFLGLFNMDNMVVLPLTTALDDFGKDHSLRMNVVADGPELVQRAQDEVTAVLRRRRNVAPGAPNNFELDTNESVTRTFNSLSQVIAAAGAGICLLSLIVGGIGILNIMLVSVTERTREIGIRKALGAKRARILGQFAIEAVTLSSVGGVIGLALGFGIAFLSRWALGFPTVVPPWAVVLALLMSSGVGLVFGIYPAARAARLDPVEAMRAE
jgi:putative ABC transport system permease protein